MNTSLTATRAGLAGGALLAAVALAACGSAGSGPGSGGAAGSPAASSATPAASSASSSAAATSPAGGGPSAAGPSGSSGSGGSGGSGAAPSGGPVPSGFTATSVTFVSPQEGFVLGTAPCATAPCTSILRTLDRGASWRGLPTPVVALGSPGADSSGPAVWGIRFANPDDGFVFGNGLWTTTDGGERWTQAASPGGPIESLEVIDDQVLALTAVCTPNDGCGLTDTLMRRPLAEGAWQTVARVTRPGAIATQARVAAVVDGSSVLVTADGGVTSDVRPTPCTTEGVNEPTAVAVTGPSGLALLCAGQGAAGSVQKTVFVSDDLGSHWTRAGSPASGGDPVGISAGSASQLVVSAASGASMLYYSADGGARWSTVFDAGDGGLSFNDLGFTTPSDGVVVYAPAIPNSGPEGRPGRLLLTSNGGASWQAVSY